MGVVAVGREDVAVAGDVLAERIQVQLWLRVWIVVIPRPEAVDVAVDVEKNARGEVYKKLT